MHIKDVHFARLANALPITKKVHETITFLLVTLFTVLKNSPTDSAINFS